MKKILIILISFLPVASFAQFTDCDTIGMPSHNQAVGNGFQVSGDTLYHLGSTILLPNVVAVGSAGDSVLVKDTSSGVGKVKLIVQPPGTQNSSACNLSVGFGTMNVNNSSQQNTNVGINAGHNLLFNSVGNV